jgi:type II secretory pathway component GspD/PulD (secretin)
MPPGKAGEAGGPPGKAGEAAKTAGPSGKTPDGGKPDDAPKPLKRPAKPDTPPNPAELKVGPDKQGNYKINFNGQPWLPVLQWLADQCKMSLEWQELPGDYLNLTTQRSYKIREVRDLINRRLLVRGYTLLCQDETLTVVNTKNLDTSLVPRVDPEELDRRDPFEFVKVSFALDWLSADTAVRELKPMVSCNGKLTAMADVNRIEAVDTVDNLRQIRAVLKQEQSLESQQRLVRKFKLVHARADDVRDELQTLLGSDVRSSTPGRPQSSEQAQQAAMMAARMQQQAAQQGQQGQQAQQASAAAAAKMGVAVVANQRENSILVTAPPDKMAIVVQVIKAVDVPTDSERSLVGAMNRMQVYRLAGIDPEPVVKTLEEIGNLNPSTHLEVDKKNKAIIAYASLADHVTIRAVVDKLSGSDRSFEVVRLRRLRADSVAASIEFMMGIDSKKKKKETRHYWSPWDDYSSNSNDKSNEFRVDADVEQNRLLLWANEVELGEVQNLLTKLGETPQKGNGNKAIRVIDAGDAQEIGSLLKRIRSEWSAMSPNPLSLPPPLPSKGKADAETQRETSPDAELSSPPSKTTAIPPVGTVLRLTDLRRDVPPEEVAGGPAESSRKTPAPIDVRVGPDGKLVVSSQDTQALDLFEELISQLATPRREYEVFHLHYASAGSVALNLEDFFKDETKKSGSSLPFWIRDELGLDDSDSDSDDKRLSKRRKLKFISDPDTNSILVTGANAAQLKTIKDLIAVYDKQPPENSELSRQMGIFYLRHAKAKAVHDTVKDVYRDLLSENDKALANPNQQRGGRRMGFFGFSGDESNTNEQKPPKFKGSLSIGIDEASNSLVVSAPKNVFIPVSKMIQDLDEAAAAHHAVRVLKVGHGVTADRLREIIDALQGQGSSGGAAAAPTPRPPAARRGSKPPAIGGMPAAAPAPSGQ